MTGLTSPGLARSEARPEVQNRPSALGQCRVRVALKPDDFAMVSIKKPHGKAPALFVISLQDI